MHDPKQESTDINIRVWICVGIPNCLEYLECFDPKVVVRAERHRSRDAHSRPAGRGESLGAEVASASAS